MREWWVWQYDFGERRAFIECADESAPERRWTNRHKIDSELNDHLRALDYEPVVVPVLSTPLPHNLARALKRTVQDRLKDQGYRILSARDRKTFSKAGRLKPQPVYVELHGRTRWFPSVARAARFLGKHPSTVWLMANSPTRQDIWFDKPGVNKKCDF